MLRQQKLKELRKALSRQAAVLIVGPRQAGKTTLAKTYAATTPSLYLDLELPSDRDKLKDPELFFQLHQDKLVILDEIHRQPELFQILRGIIDQGRHNNKGTGRFLILGSASISLLQQSGESLAGRIEYLELPPLTIQETQQAEITPSQVWLRGGFPQSLLAKNEEDSFQFRQNFLRSYLEQEIPLFGPRISSTTLEFLWKMLAHHQGTLLNSSKLANNLALSSPTVTNYINLLTDLFLIRRLPPHHSNFKKRMVKSPKTYVRDSGVLHTLLGIQDIGTLLGHPVVGASWEGFVIENIAALLAPGKRLSFYRTAAGAEIDLLIDLGAKHGIWALEIKHGLRTHPSRGFYHGREDIQPTKSFLLYGGQERYPLGNEVEAISLPLFLQELKQLA